MGVPPPSKKGRRRSFDWAEARALYEAGGWTYAALGRRYGVTAQAIRLACDDAFRDRLARYQAEWQRGGVCRRCGAQCSRNRARVESQLCRRCSDEDAVTSVRVRDGVSEAKCFSCGRWKEVSAFVRSGRRGLRGLHGTCRECNTAAKRRARLDPVYRQHENDLARLSRARKRGAG